MRGPVPRRPWTREHPHSFTQRSQRTWPGVRAWRTYTPGRSAETSRVCRAAPDHVPQPLVEQLKLGGRLVVPVGRDIQLLLVYTRTEKGLREESRLPVRFVPLTRKPG